MPRGRSYQVLTYISPFLTLGSAKHITSVQADISLATGEYHACEASISLFSRREKNKKVRLPKRRTAKNTSAIPLFFVNRTIIRFSLTRKIRVGLLAFALGDGLRGDLIQLYPTVSHQPTALCKDLEISLLINALVNYNIIRLSCQYRNYRNELFIQRLFWATFTKNLQ